MKPPNLAFLTKTHSFHIYRGTCVIALTTIRDEMTFVKKSAREHKSRVSHHDIWGHNSLHLQNVGHSWYAITAQWCYRAGAILTFQLTPFKRMINEFGHRSHFKAASHVVDVHRKTWIAWCRPTTGRSRGECAKKTKNVANILATCS